MVAQTVNMCTNGQYMHSRSDIHPWQTLKRHLPPPLLSPKQELVHLFTPPPHHPTLLPSPKQELVQLSIPPAAYDDVVQFLSDVPYGAEDVRARTIQRGAETMAVLAYARRTHRRYIRCSGSEVRDRGRYSSMFLPL